MAKIMALVLVFSLSLDILIHIECSKIRIKELFYRILGVPPAGFSPKTVLGLDIWVVETILKKYFFDGAIQGSLTESYFSLDLPVNQFCLSRIEIETTSVYTYTFMHKFIPDARSVEKYVSHPMPLELFVKKWRAKVVQNA